ncbi:hypothetical protein [Azohydromonas australica]|uniref:hypothetical protein n=1 Tax=Azohydromonas australica TaxID=364039 RepID=UPI0012EBD5B9|nr:hypothetical protein [Azohydromonas australica]
MKTLLQQSYSFFETNLDYNMPIKTALTTMSTLGANPIFKQFESFCFIQGCVVFPFAIARAVPELAAIGLLGMPGVRVWCAAPLLRSKVGLPARR